MIDLSKKSCVPCNAGTPKLKAAEIRGLIPKLRPDWKVIDDHHLERTLLFKNFREALAFTNSVGEIAEKEQHHPDIYLAWGKVKITLWTHKINGLSENDFILAARIDKLQ